MAKSWQWDQRMLLIIEWFLLFGKKYRNIDEMATNDVIIRNFVNQWRILCTINMLSCVCFWRLKKRKRYFFYLLLKLWFFIETETKTLAQQQTSLLLFDRYIRIKELSSERIVNWHLCAYEHVIWYKLTRFPPLSLSSSFYFFFTFVSLFFLSFLILWNRRTHSFTK